MAATTEKQRRGADLLLPASRPLPEIEQLIEERVKSELALRLAPAVSAKVAEIARAVPRRVFDGDDALFMSWMAGFTAGYHAANPNDKHAVQIFERCRAFSDKLATIAPAEGNGS